MQTPRLRLYTKNITYMRMVCGLIHCGAQDDIKRTEHIIAGYTGARHAVLTSMGRMAIYEGLKALDRKGEIILSPLTVPEVISLIHMAGFTPVFGDVEPGTWNMDVKKAESLITEKTVAVMATYLYGNTNISRDVRALCDKHNLIMVEDAAQAAGSWNGKHHAGTLGDFGILSFSYPKNVTSFYGGCLITHDDALADKVRASINSQPAADLRWLYKKVLACVIKDIGTWLPLFQLSARIIRYGYRHHIQPIINLVSQDLNPEFFDRMPAAYARRISPQQAKAIADKWPEVDEDVQHRIHCAQTYHRLLKDIPAIICPVLVTDRSHGYLYFPIQVPDKAALQHYMIEHGCDVAVQHIPNCADLPTYQRYYRDCPHARAAAQGTLMLPVYRGFPVSQAEHYAQTIRKYFSA